MTKRLMVVGAGWDQTPIIERARSRGYYVIALDGNAQAHGMRYADKAYAISTRDSEAVLAAAQQERIDGITYMITESPLYAIRHVANAMGLVGPSQKSVEATVSKVRMREIFDDAGIPNARFGRARTVEEAEALADRIGYPLVIKSADVGGQLGLFKLERREQVADAFDVAKSYSVGGEAILEEWLEGREVNGVAVVMDGRIRELTISDRLKHPQRSFGIVHRHLFPSACLPDELGAVADICQQTVEAMEIRNGIVFPQIIVTPRGPKLAETGERIPGGVMKELFELATGIDLVDLQLDISLNQLRELEHYRTLPRYPAVTVKFMNCDPGPLKPGKVAQVVGRERALTLPGIVEAQFYNDPTKPQEIRPLRNARDRFYIVIAVGETREEVIARSNAAADVLDFLDEQGHSLKLDSPEAWDEQ